MFSKSIVTTSLLLALLAPSTLVSAAPVGSSPTNTAELTTRARLPIRIVRDGLPIKIIGARDNLEQDRSLLSKREPQPGRNNISNPRGDILKGLLEKLGERKRDLATIDLDARETSPATKSWLGTILPNTGIRPSGCIGPGGRNPTSSPGRHSPWPVCIWKQDFDLQGLFKTFPSVDR
ncbi:hypothetical protein BKA70DRAFT_1237505 [Coprinopsis sp. MPI-PUGE-AT-0042]|nr:hypothetical protein BKA70DRAFT_1237505 [Coprinopsis sp. MPI-PUGE-AT-0042]